MTQAATHGVKTSIDNPPRVRMTSISWVAYVTEESGSLA